MAADQGADLSACSTLDMARSGADAEDLFMFDGYGSLVEQLAQGLPIELEAEVDSVDWGGAGVVINSSQGEFSCRSVIITVSTGVLAANRIEFQRKITDISPAC